MTVVCTRCGALSVHQCQCVNPITYTGSATPNAPTRDLVSLPKDSQEIISEKLSQSAAEQAPGPTTKESSAVEPAEIAKRAALALVASTAKALPESVTNGNHWSTDAFRLAFARLERELNDYREAYDYAKSIGAIE